MIMNFEENVYYFTKLVFNNIQSAKTKKNKRKEVFKCLKVKPKENKIIVYNKEKKYSFILQTKQINEYDFKQYLTKFIALYYIDFNIIYYILKEDRDYIKYDNIKDKLN